MKTSWLRIAALAWSVFAAQSLAAPFAYVTRSGDNGSALLVIDTATNVVAVTIPVEFSALGVAISPSGKLAYVPHVFLEQISAIDLTTNRVVARIPIPSPMGVVFNASGSRAYVSSVGVFAPGTAVSVIDTRTHAVILTSPGHSGPTGLALNPSGTRLYVANSANATVSVHSASTMARVATIALSQNPLGLAMHPNGTRLFVSHVGGEDSPPANSVSVIDLATDALIETITVGTEPFGLAIEPSGGRLFVANSASGTVSVIDTATSRVVATVPAGERPVAIGFHPSGSHFYVVNNDSADVTIVDARTLVRIGSVVVGDLPAGFGPFVGPHTSIGENTPGILSGIWWNPAESGWGIQLTQRRDNIFATWYTYDGAGNAKWYATDGCRLSSLPCATCVASTTCSGDLYETTGTRYFGVPAFSSSAVRRFGSGDLRIDFRDANNATMAYSLGGQTRTVALSRYMFRAGGVMPNVDYTDMWWNPSESGWGLSITHQANVMFLAWYVYDEAGAPTWYAVSDCAVSAAGNGCSGAVHRMTGPPFGPTYNASLVIGRVSGTASVTFADADSGTLSYTVDGVSGSKALRRFVF